MKKPTKPKRKPASVLAWTVLGEDGPIPGYCNPLRANAEYFACDRRKLVRVRITVVPKGAKR